MGNFLYVSQEEYQYRRRENMRVYSYVNRVAGPLVAHMGTMDGTAFALFDGEGCLLKLYGSEAALAFLGGKGIRRGSLWNAEALGHNAVVDGLAASKPLSSVGAENESEALHSFTLAFAPVVLQETFSPYQVLSTCGVAAIAPADQPSAGLLVSTLMLADDIQFEYHASQLSYRIYEGSPYARLDLNLNSFARKAMVYYCSEDIFDILGIPKQDLMYKPLEELVDPLPHNREFWSIVWDTQRVRNRYLTLRIQGREIDCILATDPYQQPRVNVRGIEISITTQRKISAQVSEKMGNNAIRTFDTIIGESTVIRAMKQKGKLLSRTSGNILLLGESGVGKDVFAQAIHNTSDRRDKPFIAVNCGALPRDLIASELFGYESGAFTGAKRQGNIGKFELANGGTIFLDEIGELPLDLQATLLRVVEQKQFMRLGGKKNIDIDVKIISATNLNLREKVAQNKFRADLYYRLCTMRVHIPPLRERGDDILLLARYFIQTISQRIGRSDLMTLSPDAEQLMMELPWQGNVRELQNLMECIVQLYPGDRTITPTHILENIDPDEPQPENLPAPSAYRPPVSVPKPRRPLLTAEEILAAVEQCHGNRSEAARALGITRKTLYRNLERLGLKLPD